MRILLVEDQEDIARQVERSLLRVDHEVMVAKDGPSAVEMAAEHRVDCLVLDIQLPGFDGFEVLRRIREAGNPARVIMLTALSEVGDRVAGLKAGADDYLTKPFAIEELLARIDALGRRSAPVTEVSMLENGEIALDVVNRRVTRGGKRVVLSPREFEVLQIFMREPGRLFSRDELSERIWEREHEYDTRTVEIFIMRLRKKLDRPDQPSILETVRGIGYRLREG